MSNENSWDKIFKNSDISINDIDNLDECKLVDDIEESSKEGPIKIDFVDENDDINKDFLDEDTKKDILFEQTDVKLEEDTVEISLDAKNDAQVETVEKQEIINLNIDDNISEKTTEVKSTEIKPKEASMSDEELKILNIKPEESPSIEKEELKFESESEKFMKLTKEYGQDLDKFGIAKNLNEENEEESAEPEEDKDIEEPIVLEGEELSTTADNIDVEIKAPKDFSEIISNNGEILDDYISGSSKFKDISENLQVCISLAELFCKVHKLGGCFNGLTAKDIIVTANRECMIINKNKVVELDDDEYSLIYNKYCAPEILRSEYRPNEITDTHTLSVLMFGVLFKSNPFEGKKFINTVFYTQAEELVYYANPIFIYSHKDESNVPVYGINTMVIKYWDKYYSEDIKLMFKQIFVEGVEEPDSRPTEKRIIEILAEYKQLRDQFSKKSFSKLDFSKKDSSKNKENKDSQENKKDDNTIKNEIKNDDGIPKLELIVYSKIYQSTEYSITARIPLLPGREIYNKLIGYENEPHDELIGKVIQNAKNKSIIGIKNLSNHTWIAKKGDVEKSFPTGKVIVLSEGIEIDFYPENISANKDIYFVLNLK